jgi:hypothetical protein
MSVLSIGEFGISYKILVQKPHRKTVLGKCSYRLKAEKWLIKE